MKRLPYYALFWVLCALGLFSWPKQDIKSEDVVAPEKSVTAGVEVKASHATRKLSEGEFEFLLKKSPWPKELYAAVKRIAFCESSWIPTAKGPTDDHGLMQVRFANHAGKVNVAKDLYDPLRNLAVAHTIFLEAKHGKWKHGFAPWYMSNGCHGMLPKQVAVRIKQFRSKKFVLAKAQ